MPVINSTTPITADGTYFFQRLKPGAQYILTASGTFGAATITPGYDDNAGNFVAYRDSAAALITSTAATGWKVDAPESGILALLVTGSTGASIRIGIAGAMQA